ncbi:MAG TPA: hypothetical protein VL651_06170, partial [Bacteroidia bacterium]|nr:hypothetical protein [Bacteroidia bacterium]
MTKSPILFSPQGKLKPGLQAFLLLGFGTIILSWIAFYNRYPLTYSDTGTYIDCGFSNYVPKDRPILYGLFLRHVSMKFSLWLVVFAQALLTSCTLFVFITTFITSRRNRNILFIIVVLLLSFTTGISQKCSDLLPDFLTAITCLLFVVQLVRPPERIKQVFIILVLLFALSAHNSHLFILTLTMTVFTLFRFISRSTVSLISPRRLMNGWIILASGFALTLFINLTYTGKFFISQNGKIFMMGHLADCGLLDEFLDDNCGTKNYELCQYHQVPFSKIDFIWANESPLYKTGGWEKHGDQFDPVLGDLFGSSHYVGRFITSSTYTSLKQLISFHLDVKQENIPMGKGSPPGGQIEWRFPKELNAYLGSRQNTSRLSYVFLDILQTFMLVISIPIILYALLFRRKNNLVKALRIATYFILTFIVCNAIVCGTLTIANSRFG